MYRTPEIIARTAAWLATDAGYIRLMKEHPNQRYHDPFADVPMVSVPITVSDMGGVDTKLEPLIRELHRRRCFYPACDNAVSGRLVRYTYDHWHTPHQELRDRKGNLHVVRHITGLKCKSPQSKHVLLTGETLTVEASASEIGGAHYPVVIDYQGVSFWVDVQQMQTVYPGWNKRLALCSHLDISDRELLSQVLTPDLPAQDINMTDVRF